MFNRFQLSLEFGHFPSVRREMFINARRNDAALRQEGHVNCECQMLKIHMALLTEGERTSVASINMALLTEGERATVASINMALLTEGERTSVASINMALLTEGDPNREVGDT
jgi:hypothetical protein